MAFGEILRRSPHAHGISLREVEKVARAAASEQEFLDLVQRVEALSGGSAKAFAAVAK
jgi:hypothetical protein